MVGAAGGGLVLAVADFGDLGFVLFAGMAVSAYLLARVGDRSAALALRALHSSRRPPTAAG